MLDGRVKTLAARVGDMVSPGVVLVEIEDRDELLDELGLAPDEGEVALDGRTHVEPRMVPAVPTPTWPALWPQGAFAAEGCEALNPQACMDAFLHYSLVQVMRSIWFFDRPLLMVARWIEGLRAYLVDGVLATAFDATIAGIQVPFWMMAAAAWCRTCSPAMSTRPWSIRR